MRVRIVGTPDIDLATTGTDAARDFRINGSQITQEAALFRAEEIIPLDRGNEKTVITFLRKRDHGTYDAAEEFLLGHKATLPRIGKVEFVTNNGAVVFFLEPASILVAESHYFGVLTYHRYQITGGRVKTP